MTCRYRKQLIVRAPPLGVCSFISIEFLYIEGRLLLIMLRYMSAHGCFLLLWQWNISSVDWSVCSYQNNGPSEYTLASICIASLNVRSQPLRTRNTKHFVVDIRMTRCSMKVIGMLHWVYQSIAVIKSKK